MSTNIKTRTISLPRALVNRLQKNKELGTLWRINVSKICATAINKKLDELDEEFTRHQELKNNINQFLETDFEQIDPETFKSIKETLNEIQEALQQRTQK